MTSDSKLEKSIKRYSDVFGTVLLGMHQDLQAQQQTVDRKLAEWDQLARKRSEEILAAKAAFTSIGDEVKSRAAAVGHACERLERVVESTNVAMTKQLDAIDAASANLFEDIKSLLSQARAESAKRLEAIEQAQSLYQSRAEAFAKQTEDIKSLLSQARAESAKRLEAIEQMQSLYQSRAEAFAKQTRRLLFAAVGIAAALSFFGMFMR